MRLCHWSWFLALLGLSGLCAWTVVRPPDILFERHTIDLGVNETCAITDVDGDGRLDIVSGENWYQGPGAIKHRFRDLNFANNYIDNFTDLAIDVDADGQIDVVSGSYGVKRLAWWRNPGKGAGTWNEHLIEEGASVEFAFLVDLDNDGKPKELLPQFGQRSAPLAWYEIQDGAFVKHIVSEQSYGHGIGAGDVSGDGRTDILTPEGWFEAPANPRTKEWKWHPDFQLGMVGFIYVLDVNGDGRNDIVTSAAHDYGIFWLEHGEGNVWTKRVIDDSWSQAHAMTMVDLNADGNMDFLTGKRLLAHNGRDPGEREPLGIYWYEYLRRTDGKPVEWVKHIVEYGSRAGGGTQIPVSDLDGDGDLDFVVAGKGGVFLFENLTRKRQ